MPEDWKLSRMIFYTRIRVTFKIATAIGISSCEAIL